MLRKLIVGAVVLVVGVAALLWFDPKILVTMKVRPGSPLEVHAVRDGVYWVESKVVNSGFIVGDDGVIVIDAQMFAVTARNELAEIARITPKPVTHIILTHSDPDHVLGLTGMPAGLPVIAQVNTRNDMQGSGADSMMGPAPKALQQYLPDTLVEHRLELKLDGVNLVLLHTAPAHTDGDLIIYLPSKKIVFAGDILTPGSGPYPGIHLEKRGSSLGWIASAKAMLALDADIFISGHGPPLNRSDLEGRIRVAEERRAQIKALVDQHKTLEEIRSALLDRKPSGAAGLFPTFTETTYKELFAK